MSVCEKCVGVERESRAEFESLTVDVADTNDHLLRSASQAVGDQLRNRSCCDPPDERIEATHPRRDHMWCVAGRLRSEPAAPCHGNHDDQAHQWPDQPTRWGMAR